MPKNNDSMNNCTKSIWNAPLYGQKPGTSSNRQLTKNIHQCMERHYINLNKKLDQLSFKQPKRPAQPRREDDRHFYSRVKNLTNIRFSQEEMYLLKHGLNYTLKNRFQPTLPTW